MPVEPRSLKELFLAALAVAPPDRAAWLQRECGQDAELRQRLERMLAAHETPQSLLDRLAPAVLPVEGATGALAAEDERPPRADREEAGAVIAGRYKLVEAIGEGGMGTVWLAQQTEPVKRLVALKVIKPGMDSQQVLARFEAERQALALMDHPNIARVLDAGAAETGRPFFVMELVKGVPITRYCDEYRLTPRQRLELFIPVCQAIQHAHQKGIIHRDIKPSNVLVAQYDSMPAPKVIDFGIAKATGQPLTEHTLVTGFGAIVGTLEYMSPEQAQFNQLDIDTRSDVYALGVLLYELLTGGTPLDRKRLKETALLEVLRLIREEEPPRPSTRLSTTEGLPAIAANRGLEPKKLSGLLRGELDWIVMKTLEKDRNRRYETANGLALDLQRYLRDEAVLACPPSAWYRFRKYARRNRGPVLAATFVFVALLLGLAVASWQAVEARVAGAKEANQRQVAEAEKKAADAARKTAEEQRDRAEWLVYAGKLALAQLEFHDKNGTRALVLLEECQGKLRNWEHHHLWTRFSSKQTFLGHVAPVLSVCFSPDGKRLASAGGVFGKPGKPFGEVKVWDAETGQEVLTLQGHTGTVYCVCFSPDGKQIASASSDRTIKVWDAETGQEVLALRGHTSGIPSVCFSPDGKQIASACQDGLVKLWNAETGQEVRVFRGHRDMVLSVCFSPDGKQLASGSFDDTARVWDAGTGREIRTLKGHGSAVSRVCFSPDGKQLASASFDATVKVWNAGTGQEIRTLKGHTGRVHSVCFSTDGKRLATASDDRTIKVWDAETGQEVHTLQGHANWVWSVAFSPNGKKLASASYDAAVKVWDAEKGQDDLAFKGHAGQVSSVCWSPDGRRLASASFDRAVKVWDAATGQELLALKGHVGSVTCVCFSPDGKRLLSAAGLHGRPDQPDQPRVWDATTGQETLALKGHGKPVEGVAWSPAGNRLASASHDQTVKLWDAETGREVLTLKGHTSEVRRVCFSPDGNRLASASGDSKPSKPGEVKVWDAQTGQEMRAFTGHAGLIASVCFSPDGKQIASASHETVKVWDAETGEELLALKGHASVRSVCFSPDGKRLAAATSDVTMNAVVVWEVETGQEVLVLKGHARTHAVSSLCFSPNGHRLAAACQDGTVKVWDAEKHQGVR